MASKVKDSLGDRMKAYEEQETYARFLPNVPIVARIDGRRFSKFTKDMARPFDTAFSYVMRNVTANLVKETSACSGYTQSDEINLCWYNPKPGSDIFFSGRKFKMTAQLAALATAHFHVVAQPLIGREIIAKQVPTFDARAFQVPTLAEGANAFLWRQRDCRKNAVSMIARTFFSHKELLNKNSREMLAMLEPHGVSLKDYPWESTEGSFIRRIITELDPASLTDIPEAHRPTEPILRSRYVEQQIPLLSTLSNAVDVVFFGAEPLTKDNNHG